MVSRPLSIADLTRLGADEIAHLLGREHPPATPLEWLGIAIAHLPQLAARGRTADDVHLRSRTQSPELRSALLDALLEELGIATAMLEQARARLLERYPDSDGEGGAEVYAELLQAAHRSAPRHAEMMMSGHAAFIGAAVEAAGALGQSELELAGPRRWERGDTEALVAIHAAQLHTAISNAIGGLLAYARLVAEDARRIQP